MEILVLFLLSSKWGTMLLPRNRDHSELNEWEEKKGSSTFLLKWHFLEPHNSYTNSNLIHVAIKAYILFCFYVADLNIGWKHLQI